MNNLSNEIVHLSKVLEKQIPKGYHEIVTEYVRQNIVNGIFDVLEAMVVIFVLYLLIKVFVRSINNKEGFYYYEYEISLSGIFMNVGVATLSIILVFAFFYDLEHAAGSIQHAVAPNYYLIRSFIK